MANIATATSSVLDTTKRVASAVFKWNAQMIASLAGSDAFVSPGVMQDTTKMQTESVAPALVSEEHHAIQSAQPTDTKSTRNRKSAHQLRSADRHLQIPQSAICCS